MNPPYQQQPMMQQPPMGGPMPSPQNMGGPPPRARVIRRGTSRAVPIVVSAGLAIGVFCGLLFGLGTGKNEATAAPSTGNNVKPKDKDDVPEAFAPSEAKPIKPPPGGQVAAAGSGSGSAAPAGVGSGSGSAAVPTPAVMKTHLTITVKPEAAAKVAKISIDGKEIEGAASDLELTAGKKLKVKVSVKAAGYRDASQELTVDENDEKATVEFDLTKKSSGGGGPSRPSVPGGGKKPGGKKPGGGLIDI